MRLLPLLLLAATAAAAPPTTQRHEAFVSQVTLGVRQVPETGWLASGSRWEVEDVDMNPIVTNPASRAHYEAMADADVDHDSPWALWVDQGTAAAKRVPVAPHANFSPEGGPPQAYLEFLVRMNPEVQALELRHGETLVHTWRRPEAPPPTPTLDATCRLPAYRAPARCAFSWEPPPEGLWVQLMTRELRRNEPWTSRGPGGWRAPRLAPGLTRHELASRTGRVLGELTFTDGFTCLATRAVAGR